MFVASQLVSIVYAGKSEYSWWFYSIVMWAHLSYRSYLQCWYYEVQRLLSKTLSWLYVKWWRMWRVRGKDRDISRRSWSSDIEKKKTKQPQPSYPKQMCGVPRKDLFMLLILWRSGGSAMWCNNRSQLPSNSYSRASQLQTWPLLKFRVRSSTAYRVPSPLNSNYRQWKMLERILI